MSDKVYVKLFGSGDDEVFIKIPYGSPIHNVTKDSNKKPNMNFLSKIFPYKKLVGDKLAYILKN